MNSTDPIVPLRNEKNRKKLKWADLTRGLIFSQTIPELESDGTYKIDGM